MKEPMDPTRAFALRLRETREALGLSKRDLAQRLTEIGFPLDRFAIGRIEAAGGPPPARKAITLDEVLALAAALGVAPIHLVVPEEGEIELGEALHVAAPEVRRWVRGERPLPGADEITYYTMMKAECYMGEQWRELAFPGAQPKKIRVQVPSGTRIKVHVPIECEIEEPDGRLRQGDALVFYPLGDGWAVDLYWVGLTGYSGCSGQGKFVADAVADLLENEAAHLTIRSEP